MFKCFKNRACSAAGFLVHGNNLFPVNSLKIYQIGLGSFGRYGFEKFVELHNHFDRVDVELKGVCDQDLEKLENAEKFASANDIEVETFTRTDKMYDAASEHEHVLVYDAGPTEEHASNIYESMRHGFYHLTEKPPSLEREQHMKEKKLAEENNVMWMVDFIERESPVVKKVAKIIPDIDVDSIRVFRESSVGVQKLLDPVSRAGVKGGDVLDKMTHEVYVLDFLGDELELQDAETEYFMPKDFNSDKFLAVDGSPINEINAKTATARTSARFRSGGTEVELNSSWVGLSDEARLEAKKVEELTGEKIIEQDYRMVNDEAFLDSEARFFLVEGSRNLAGDMLNNRLYDLDTGEELEVPDLMHDQLYRVIERAVLAADGEDHSIGNTENRFMNAIFDVKDAVVGDHDYYTELDRAREKMESLVVRDGKILEPQESERIAG